MPFITLVKMSSRFDAKTAGVLHLLTYKAFLGRQSSDLHDLWFRTIRDASSDYQCMMMGSTVLYRGQGEIDAFIKRCESLPQDFADFAKRAD